VKSSAVDPANGRISHSLALLHEVLVPSPVPSHLSRSVPQTLARPPVSLQGCLLLPGSVGLVPPFWAESGCVELRAGMPVVYSRIQVRFCWHLLRLRGLIMVREGMAMEGSLVLCSQLLRWPGAGQAAPLCRQGRSVILGLGVKSRLP